MKRKLAVILACLMFSAAFAGCASQNNETSSTESNSAVSSASSSDSRNEGSADSKESGVSQISSADDNSDEQVQSDAENTDESGLVIDIGDDNPGISIDEEGNITIDPEQLSGWDEDPDGGEEGDEGDEGGEDGTQSQYAEVMYQTIGLSPDGFGADFDKPVAYGVTSEEQLRKFIADNDAKYSLTKTYSGGSEDMISTSFENETAEMNSDFFEICDVMIVVAPYSKSGEIDLGDISEQESGNVKAVIWAQNPTDNSDKGYACMIITLQKDAIKGKTVSAEIDPNAYIQEDIPEGEEDIEVLDEEL